MTLELIDMNNMSYRIDTSDPEVMAKWFEGYLPVIMRTPRDFWWRLRVWPMSEAEVKAFDAPFPFMVPVNKKGYEELAMLFQRIANSVRD